MFSPSNDKKCMKITNVLQSILDGSIRKLNKMWVDKSDECCNREIKS